MTLRNTSRYDTREVRELVRFATSEVDMRGVHVNVKNANNTAFRGMAYIGVPFISNAPPKADYLVTIGIGAEDHFPMSRIHRRMTSRWPEYEMNNWREALVVVAAHEAKHIEQFKEDKPRSEIACEYFAARMLRRYREDWPIRRRRQASAVVPGGSL
jgi:hypothetical protein